MTRHLHHDDYPNTLALLSSLVGHRTDDERLGYMVDEWGAEVDWDLLTSTDAPVSSTERAALIVAHGCSILECHGGLPPQLRRVVIAVVDAVA